MLANALYNLATTLHCQAQITNCESRKAMHLAAVFSSNFTNYMYYCAEVLSNKHNVNFNMLQPLIAETANRILHHLPSTVQTGPAVRGDIATQDAHLTMLNNNEVFKAIYIKLSEAILEHLG